MKILLNSKGSIQKIVSYLKDCLTIQAIGEPFSRLSMIYGLFQGTK